MSWKFNPPPGWPVPSDDWFPPPGWEPDPSWPAAPPGWEFWVQAEEAKTPPGPAGPSAGSPPPLDPWPTPAPYPPVPPSFPPPPPRQPGSGPRPGLVAGAVLGAVLLVLATGGVAVTLNWNRMFSEDGVTRVPPRAAPAEFDRWAECRDVPNTCNSGAVQDGGELVWALSTGVETWNLHTIPAGGLTLEQIMSGVAPSTGSLLPDGNWQWNQDLLAGEPVQIGQDPDTYRYEIRPEAVWSDGTDITADDFIFQWRQRSGQEEHCAGCVPVRTLGYDRIADVTGSDGGKTVTVTFQRDRPYPDWWSLFTGLYPAHRAEAEGFDLDTPEGTAGAAEWFADTVPDWSGGPWQVTRGELEQEVVLEPNPAWYGDGPALDRIVFEMMNEPADMAVAAESGRIDGFGPNFDPWIAPVSAPHLMEHVGSSYAWDHLDFNLTREWVDDPALRRAIFTAVDITALIEVAYEHSAPETRPIRNHLFPPDSRYYEDHFVDTAQGTGDVELARSVLTDAGYEFQDGRLTLDGEQVGPLTLQTSDGNPRREVITGQAADQLAEIGIEVEVETDALGPILNDRDYDLVLYGWTGGAPFADSGYQFWHSDSPSNFGGYADDEVDDLVTEATYASDVDEAAELLNRAMSLLVTDAYVLPITYTPQQTVVSDQFHNIRPHPTVDLFANSHEWGVGRLTGPLTPPERARSQAESPPAGPRSSGPRAGGAGSSWRAATARW